jgi:hypothetical protein
VDVAQPEITSEPPGPDWYAELEELAQRHEFGELSDDEFAREKRRILESARRLRTIPSDTPDPDTCPTESDSDAS